MLFQENLPLCPACRNENLSDTVYSVSVPHLRGFENASDQITQDSFPFFGHASAPGFSRKPSPGTFAIPALAQDTSARPHLAVPGATQHFLPLQGGKISGGMIWSLLFWPGPLHHDSLFWGNLGFFRHCCSAPENETRDKGLTAVFSGLSVEPCRWLCLDFAWVAFGSLLNLLAGRKECIWLEH